MVSPQDAHSGSQCAQKGGSSLLNPEDPGERGELASRVTAAISVASPGPTCHPMVAEMLVGSHRVLGQPGAVGSPGAACFWRARHGQKGRILSGSSYHGLGPGLGQPRPRGHESHRAAGPCAQPTECYRWHRVAEKLLWREEGALLCCLPPVPPESGPHCSRHPGSARPGTAPRLSLCPELKPPRCPGGCCRRRPDHRRGVCDPWEVGGAARCSAGPSPRGAGPRSPGPCPGPGAPPAGRGGGR